MRNFEAELKKGLGLGINLVKCVIIMLVVVERDDELLKSTTSFSRKIAES